MPVSFLWLIAGAAFVALEAFGISGIGFLFAGVGALLTAVVVETGVAGAGNYVAQFAWFFGFTVLGAALLWKPLRRYQAGKLGGHYSNMVGDVAIIGEGGLRKGQAGQARWSGTIMVCELAPDASADELPAGAKAKIVAVKGATLILDHA